MAAVQDDLQSGGRMRKFVGVALAIALSSPLSSSPAQSPASALTPEEVSQLLGGEGTGQAKAAEMSGYPGPKHVLEPADKPDVSPTQRQAVTAIFDRKAADAKSLGAQIVDARSQERRVGEAE